MVKAKLKKEAPKEKAPKVVHLYDVNEKLIPIPAELEKEYLEKGYRKELPKKPE